MRIILSPAKQMKNEFEILEPTAVPVFLEKTKELLKWMQSQSHENLQKMWKCNSKIAEQNFERLKNMDLYSNLTPAILAYEGIAYKYMAPSVFENGHFDYVQKHLRIISGFYGVVKPLDGITPHRLEMGAKANLKDYKDLYDFWGDSLYKSIRSESNIIINLASNEYSKIIEKYLKPDDTFITINFCENSKGKLITKGIYAKMARGEMVRFMAENNIENPKDVREFNRLGFIYRDDISSEKEYVFERITKKKDVLKL